jgi:hypothetical protein
MVLIYCILSIYLNNSNRLFVDYLARMFLSESGSALTKKCLLFFKSNTCTTLKKKKRNYIPPNFKRIPAAKTPRKNASKP